MRTARQQDHRIKFSMETYARICQKCIPYSSPNTINSTTPNIVDKIYTHSMQGFSGYIK